jgi:predicted NodU family carbamoyl transferase
MVSFKFPPPDAPYTFKVISVIVSVIEERSKNKKHLAKLAEAPLRPVLAATEIALAVVDVLYVVAILPTVWFLTSVDQVNNCPDANFETAP